MTLKDKLGERLEIPNMHDGKGMTCAYSFFQGEIHPAMMFFNIIVKPGTYVGHHRHMDNQEILYVLSGMGENYQDGSVTVLGPGDAILVKPGEAHAMRAIGDVDLEVLGFVTKPGENIGVVENLPVPDAIADWV